MENCNPHVRPGRETRELIKAGYNTEEIILMRSERGTGGGTAMMPRKRTLGEDRAEKGEPVDYCKACCQGKGNFGGFCGNWPSGGNYTFLHRGSRNGEGHTNCTYKG